MSDERLEGVAPTVPDELSDEAVRVARLVAELTPEQQAECLTALEVMGLIAPGDGGDGEDEPRGEFVEKEDGTVVFVPAFDDEVPF